MAALKDCPICHGTPYIESITVYPRTTPEYEVYWAVCNRCGAKTERFPSRFMAVIKWNNMVKNHDKFKEN